MTFRPKKKAATKPAASKLAKANDEIQPTVQQQPPIVPASQYVPEQQIPQQQVQEEMQVWTVTDVPTETATVIYNQKTGETLDILGALVRILNTFEELAQE